MSTPPPSCPTCRSAFVSWRTELVGEVLHDRLVCETCGTVCADEDWDLPLEPTGPGFCRNCGGQRRGALCSRCGLSASEDAQVHQELLGLIGATDLLSGSAKAAEMGRRLLALKLATAAVYDSPSPGVARLLRISLLQDLDLLQAALFECQSWVRGPGAEDAHAWSLFGELQIAAGKRGLGLQSLERALELEPDCAQVRGRYASHLFDDQRYAQARAQAIWVLSSGDSVALPMGLAVAASYARRLMSQRDLAALEDLLTDLGDAVAKDATLSASRAWMLHSKGAQRQAQDALRVAHKLDPKNPLVVELEGPLGVKRWSWFGW